uniref:Uncharacterized protein n=1 Tax=Rhizophora mucronata TaxID=61149 RepID=A0A2P2P461_RHIMU
MSDRNAKTNRQHAHVIKVVPHNLRSATESAAQIFQFIQEERNSMPICENVSSEKS